MAGGENLLFKNIFWDAKNGITINFFLKVYPYFIVCIIESLIAYFGADKFCDAIDIEKNSIVSFSFKWACFLAGFLYGFMMEGHSFSEALKDISTNYKSFTYIIKRKFYFFACTRNKYFVTFVFFIFLCRSLGIFIGFTFAFTYSLIKMGIMEELALFTAIFFVAQRTIGFIKLEASAMAASLLFIEKNVTKGRKATKYLSKIIPILGFSGLFLFTFESNALFFATLVFFLGVEAGLVGNIGNFWGICQVILFAIQLTGKAAESIETNHNSISEMITSFLYLPKKSPYLFCICIIAMLPFFSLSSAYMIGLGINNSLLILWMLVSFSAYFLMGVFFIGRRINVTALS